MNMLTIRGVHVFRGYLDGEQQRAILNAVREIARAAPPFTPVTARGRRMSVQMTAAGRFGWYSDRRGYRYIPRHPDGDDWPAIPPEIMAIWEDLADCPRLPECCLVNFYGEGARMGMHQDKDEADFSWPVVSISLGDDGLFRIGNLTRGGKTESVWLNSGDVVVMGGESRLVYHGVDRIRYGSSRLLENGGRINLTLRVVT